MWNLIRTLRCGKNNTQGDIEIDDLEMFYSEQFNNCNEYNETIVAAGRREFNHAESLKGRMFLTFTYMKKDKIRYFCSRLYVCGVANHTKSPS